MPKKNGNGNSKTHPPRYFCSDPQSCYHIAFEIAEDLQRYALDAMEDGRLMDHDLLLRMRDVAGWIAQSIRHGPDEADRIFAWRIRYAKRRIRPKAKE